MKAPSDIQLIINESQKWRPDFVLLTSLVFATVLYLTPVGVLLRNYVLIFPLIGKGFSYTLTVIFGWIIVYVLLSRVLGRFYSVVFEKLPGVLELINRRTGVPPVVDIIGFCISFISAIIFLIADRFMFPLAFFGLMGFGSSMRKKIELWHVKPGYRYVDLEQIRKPDETHEGGNFDMASYNWEFELTAGELFKGRFQLAIDLGEYQRYKAKNPFNKWHNLPDNSQLIHSLVNEGITDEVLQATAYFVKVTRDRAFTDYQELSNVLAFVQSLEYDLSVEREQDYWRYPIETLREGRGDCDCFSVLAAALYHSLLHDVVVMVGKEHLCVGVAGAEGFPGTFVQVEGRKYYFCETTAEGWRIGEMPSNMSPNEFAVYKV